MYTVHCTVPIDAVKTVSRHTSRYVLRVVYEVSVHDARAAALVSATTPPLSTKYNEYNDIGNER